MRKIFRYFTKTESFLSMLIVVFIAAQVWLDLKIPDYMSSITMLVETEGSAMSEILNEGLKMLACAFGSLAASVFTCIFAARVATNFSANLRSRLFRRVQAFSMEEIGRFSTASLITRSTNDVLQVQMFCAMGLQVIIKAPIMAAWAIMKIYDKSWQWTLSTGSAVALLLLIVGICTVIALPKFRKIQSLIDDVNRVTREHVTGLPVIRAYNAEKYQENKFEKANENLTNTHLFALRTLSCMAPFIQMIMNGLALAVYWIGAIIIQNAASIQDKMVLFSDMIVYSAYAMQVVLAFMMLVIVFIMLPRASVAAHRINDVLETRPTINDGMLDDEAVENSDTVRNNRGKIEFKNVSFKYSEAEEYVLRDISFSVSKGETVAFIGATGCGKSTLVNLIPRFYDATEGSVSVDGVDVREYTQHALRKRIGYISQSAIMFAGTIRENLMYGDREITENEMKNAARIAQADEFIDELETGYDSEISQGGTNFSGGQKQRMSIARALAGKPEILIFDDSFSALDYRTDRELRDALKRELQDTTKIIVAQRIGTIRNADTIIVLEDGRVAGIGGHDELMEKCDVYKEIAYSQLSEEELA